MHRSSVGVYFSESGEMARRRMRTARVRSGNGFGNGNGFACDFGLRALRQFREKRMSANRLVSRRDAA